jgi:hypothetical protein
MYLSKKGYCIRKESLSSKEVQDIKRELTAVPLVDEKYTVQNPSFPVYIESSNILYIPKMYGISKFGLPAELKSYTGKDFNKEVQFVGNLLPHQLEPVHVVIDACKSIGGGILSLQTGQGKTICALNILSKLQGKAMVIVNKISLMNQWREEIERFLPLARVGSIQGKTVDTVGCDIVLVMLQSISRGNYDSDIFSDFKVLVVDEIQNVASKVFSKILFGLCCKYSIGLSATPTRSDGCENVFKWHIGDVLYKSTCIQKGLPLVIVRKILNAGNYKETASSDGKLQFTSMISDLVNMPNRNKFIIELLKDLCKNSGRKVLLLSERRAHLQKLSKMLTEINVDFTFGLFLGGMKESVLLESRKCRVILATFSAFSEGVSERDLNTLLLVTPKKYIGHLTNASKNEKGTMTQICGRILRKSHTEVSPMIIDFQDNFSVYRNQSSGRNMFYKQHFKTSIGKYEHVDLDSEYITVVNNDECIIDD